MDVTRIADRVGADSKIVNSTFKDTILVGPAVVALLDNVHLERCRFDAPIDVMLIEIEPNRMVTGIVGIQNCKFEDCVFQNIAIIGPPEVLRVIRESVETVQSEAPGHANAPAPVPVPSVSLASTALLDEAVPAGQTER